MQRRTRLLHHAAAAMIAASGLAAPAAAAATDDPIVITTHTRLTKVDRDLDHRDIIVDGATLVLDGPHRFRSLWLKSGAVVTHGIGPDNTLDLTITEGVRIDPACAITASGRAGATADRARDGGAIRLVVGGVLSVDGWISANGKPGAHPGEEGGNGGSINLIATALVGEGRIAACGGEPGPLDSRAATPDGGSAGDIHIRVGTTRGVGVISAVAGIDRAWSADGRTLAAAPAGQAPDGAPILEVDVALYPEGGGVINRWAMWRVEGSLGAGWALVEE